MQFKVRLSYLLRHTFHSSCIRGWIDQKAVCPLCKFQLNSVDEEINPSLNHINDRVINPRNQVNQSNLPNLNNQNLERINNEMNSQR